MFVRRGCESWTPTVVRRGNWVLRSIHTWRRYILKGTWGSSFVGNCSYLTREWGTCLDTCPGIPCLFNVPHREWGFLGCTERPLLPTPGSKTLRLLPRCIDEVILLDLSRLPLLLSRKVGTYRLGSSTFYPSWIYLQSLLPLGLLLLLNPFCL